MAVQISGNDITVPRDGSFTRNVTIGGTLTYEDVTNIDSVGLVTARQGIEIGASPGVGASISVDGNAIFSGITTATTIKSTTGIVTTLTSTTFNVDGGDATFKGTTSGRDVVFDTSLNQIRAQDNAKLCAGSSSDLEIYHNETNSYIDNYTGHIYVRNNLSTDNGGNIYLQAKSGEDGIIVNDDGAVELYHDASKKLETSSSGVTVTGTVAATSYTGSGASLTGISAGLFSSYAQVCDRKSSGSHGGSFSSGDWRTRELNTEAFDPDGIVTLSSNQFTLQSGSYFINAMAPAQSVVNHQLRLRNITDSSNELFGFAAYASQSSGNATDDNDYAFLKGRITISGAKTFELQHRCNTTRNGAGFGQPSTFGEETYASVEIYKEN